MSDNLGSGPVESHLYHAMNGLAGALHEMFNGHGPRTTGFVLMVFPLDSPGGRCNYISNGKREDIITLLREQLSYFEGMPDHGPNTRTM